MIVRQANGLAVRIKENRGKWKRFIGNYVYLIIVNSYRVCMYLSLSGENLVLQGKTQLHLSQCMSILSGCACLIRGYL
jgi:hypothetical protein